ncbi:MULTISPECIES: YqgQ family protein [Bacillaceae]|uniref:YqgQ family protein n=1 Tax=Bacillaceae TaxID=186817 RepID=UPI000BFE5C28|nr:MULTISPECIES: YqgQ family protein [Bacillaceae]PGT77670.1 cytosolic protein [Bacillus sp. AFS040349]UGB29514.1 YqgQ family protein [Metabacillus sp. B2-18]
MKTIYDVQQLLKKFGTIIYIGDRVSDLELMEEEMKQLYQSNLLEPKDYQMAVLLLRQEIQNLKDKDNLRLVICISKK